MQAHHNLASSTPKQLHTAPQYNAMSKALLAAQMRQTAPLHKDIETVETLIDSVLGSHTPSEPAANASSVEFTSPLGAMIRQAFYSHATPSSPATPSAITPSDAVVIDFRRRAQDSYVAKNTIIAG